MERRPTDTVADNANTMPQPLNDCSRLIRKLRWIGMEEEAGRLQAVLNRLPAEERPTVLGSPNTD